MTKSLIPIFLKNLEKEKKRKTKKKKIEKKNVKKKNIYIQLNKINKKSKLTFVFHLELQEQQYSKKKK